MRVSGEYDHSVKGVCGEFEEYEDVVRRIK